MSFSDNIEYLMAHPGTVAALVWTGDDRGPLFSGHFAWMEVAGGALLMLSRSEEDFASATIGEHSILAEARDGQQCAVVYPTGHPVSKVMRRMLRKAAGPKRAMRKIKVPAASGGDSQVC